MNKRTVFYAEFLAPGFVIGESWCVDVASTDPADVQWPDNAYAFRLFKRDEVVDGDDVLRGTATPLGPLYYHPDSVVQSLDEVRANPKATPILISNMECNRWPQIIWSRWGNWPQPFDRDTMQVLRGGAR